MSAASEQDPNLLAPSHPSEAKPGRNDIVVATMHYGHKRMIFEKDVAIAVRDGTVLYANVFRPPEDGGYPVVVSFDVYGKDTIHVAAAMPAGGAYTLGQYNASQYAAWEAPDPGFWVPNGYVVVKAAARGTSGSNGRISPMSQMEAEDFHDVIEWCGTQPWSSGAVVTNGVSYLAMAQWRVGQLKPPHLRAMIPWEGVSDLYREWAFHGGIPETSFCPFLDFLIKKTWPGCELDELAVGQKEHPLLDAYWQARHGNLADIEVPLYVCASWSTQGLHNRGTIEGYRQASSPHKWIEIHGRKEWETYFSREALERQLRFCDHFLKGIDNDWLDTPRVRYELRDRFYDGRTKFADAWPLPGTRYVPFHLDAESGKLQRAAPEPVVVDPFEEIVAEAQLPLERLAAEIGLPFLAACIQPLVRRRRLAVTFEGAAVVQPLGRPAGTHLERHLDVGEVAVPGPPIGVEERYLDRPAARRARGPASSS